ncbi:MAG TPA: histidine kinase dimerization/phosphoacceptor domain -containing protein [Allosphingosinicella sp.]
MTTDKQGWIASRFARLSTGPKMLLILWLALFPLGLVAILASVESARQKNADRVEQTLARLETKGQRINAALSRAALTISAASPAISLAPGDGGGCNTTLRRLEQGPADGRYALFGPGNVLRCSSSGFTPALRTPPQPGQRTLVELSPDGETLTLFIFSPAGPAEGAAQFTRDALSRLTYIPGTTRAFDLTLRQGGRRMVLREEYEDGPFVQTVHGSEPIAGGALQLSIAVSAAPISALEVLMITLPVLMWLLASVIGWLVVDRLLLRPLVRMEDIVSSYRPGNSTLDIPHVRSPAREINELGQAFEQVVRTVARHEAELEAAVDRQTRLVREVHHRVKNNLQVVASLLNLHSRGSKNADVAAAYASIQRRVDALAVVHRNHYAELEDNRGVGLKPLISELTANLRATAPANAAHIVIRLDLESYYVTQDVAVSVAFLVTEMVEYAMFCGASMVTVTLNGTEGAATALLAIESDSLRAGIACDETLTDRFERIITGLSRQLRSALERDTETGRYAVAIAVVDKAEH